MKIAPRILIIMSLTLASVFLALYCIVALIVRGSFQHQENREFDESVRQAKVLIDNQFDSLEVLTADWCNWTEAYDFLAGQNESFTENNITQQDLENCQADIIAFVSFQPRAIKGQIYRDAQGQTQPNLPQTLHAFLNDKPNRLNNLKPGKLQTGFLIVNDRPMMLTAGACLSDDRTGPPSGAILFGRWFDNEMLTKIERASGLEIGYDLATSRPNPDFDAFSLSNKCHEALPCHEPVRFDTSPYTIHSKQSNQCELRFAIFDLLDKNPLMMTISTPRYHMQQASQSLFLLVLCLLVTGVLSIVLTYILLRFLVLRRVYRLVDEVGSLHLDSEKLHHIHCEGNDEFTILAYKVNELIESMSDYDAQLRQANQNLESMYSKAKIASKTKSDFLANVSHELRTPLTAILGFAELSDANPEGLGHDAASVILRNSRHLLDIINNILDLSKVESGEIELESMLIELIPWLDEIRSMMQIRTQSDTIDLQFEFDGPVPEKIVTDPTRLRQIMINLIGNALKFTREGAVRVVIHPISDGRREELQFLIIDTGIGIPKDKLDKIFEPFSQADTSITRKYGGTGLGLAISRQLVDMFDGEFHVESRFGIGSTFSFTVKTQFWGEMLDLKQLPDSDEIAQFISRSNSPNAKGESKADETRRNDLLHDSKILLVEDGMDNQRLISFILKKAGANVTTADNGQQAIDLLKASHQDASYYPDLIFMDLQMPVVDGYSATQAIREEGYEGPIIALTAHAMVSERQKCQDIGFTDFATKPIKRDELLQIAQKYVQTYSS